MEKATQFSVLLTNRPGALAELAQALAKEKVNIRGIAVVESSEHGIVRLLVDDRRSAARAIERQGMLYTQSEVLLLRLANEPGALARVAERLAENKLNINYVYGTASTPGAEATLVVSVENMANAEKALADL